MATKKITSPENKEIAKVATKRILAPHVTEKASMQSSVNAYTFVVAKNATKLDILAEFKKEYKVTPKAINITNMPRRNTFIRGKVGTQAGIKKAIVFLKKGDTITLA
jgi:large subunit ribosomal protein L23